MVGPLGTEFSVVDPQALDPVQCETRSTPHTTLKRRGETLATRVPEAIPSHQPVVGPITQNKTPGLSCSPHNDPASNFRITRLHLSICSSPRLCCEGKRHKSRTSCSVLWLFLTFDSRCFWFTEYVLDDANASLPCHQSAFDHGEEP